MKTLYEYEPADIKMSDFAEDEKMDEVHSFLFAQMVIIGMTGFKPRDTDPPGQPMLPFQRMIADFLNSAAKSGITIAKGEPVPAVYRDESR